MVYAKEFRTSAIADREPVTWKMALLILLSALVLISDGFDVASVGYLTPALIEHWKIAPANLVPVFSAGIIGMMVGGPLMGILGDRLGRRRLIFVGLCLFGFGSLLSAAAMNAEQLAILRFFTGIGLGGVLPNILALLAETTPKRMRGRLIVTVSLGMPLGAGIAGPVAAALIPRLGWQSVFLVGGVLPLAMAVLFTLLVPESPAFLRRRAEQRDADSSQGHATTSSSQAMVGPRKTGSMRRIFEGPLRLATPLLWICQVSNQLTNYFCLSWLPTLLQAAHMSPAEASIAASLFSLGGFVGGLLLLVVIDTLGIIPLALMFLVGAPLLATMILPGVPLWGKHLLIAGAGVCSMGLQVGISAALSLLYPSSVRSMGVGIGQAAGRVGAIAAPIIGGVMLVLNVPPHLMMLVPGILFVIGALASFGVALICFRRLGSWKAGELSLDTSAPGDGRMSPG